jgi:nitroreductase
MEVFEAVRTVLAVRNYQDTAVPPEVVRQIVAAGQLTASAKNEQPWHFIVVENRETLRQIGALALTGPYIAQALLAIVVVIEKTPLAVSDASRAIQSMILTAWSVGVGSNWVGFLGLAEVKTLLDVVFLFVRLMRQRAQEIEIGLAQGRCGIGAATIPAIDLGQL